MRGWPNEDAHGLFATERQATAADLDKARRAVAEHLNATANPNTHFRQPADPAGLTRDVANLRPLTGTEAFQRQEEFDAHETPARREEAAGLLRLNLNLLYRIGTGCQGD
jgi:hypothetical protein